MSTLPHAPQMEKVDPMKVNLFFIYRYPNR